MCGWWFHEFPAAIVDECFVLVRPYVGFDVVLVSGIHFVVSFVDVPTVRLDVTSRVVKCLEGHTV